MPSAECICYVLEKNKNKCVFVFPTFFKNFSSKRSNIATLTKLPYVANVCKIDIRVQLFTVLLYIYTIYYNIEYILELLMCVFWSVTTQPSKIRKTENYIFPHENVNVDNTHHMHKSCATRWCFSNIFIVDFGGELSFSF